MSEKTVNVAAEIIGPDDRMRSASYMVTPETALSFLTISTRHTIRSTEINFFGAYYYIDEATPHYDLELNLTGLSLKLYRTP